jgi:hypothetical protein
LTRTPPDTDPQLGTRREIGDNDQVSNLAPFKSNPQPGLPTPPRGDTIAQFGTYLEAQKAVDYLSDNHFPVQAVTIVGVDLKMVERVTGRLTYGRVALAGLASGAWFGLFVGLLISLFGSAEGFSVFFAVFIGAAFGLLFGVMSYAFTGGSRDFTSTSQIVAGEYRVLCLTEQAGKAMQLLNELSRKGGPTSSGGSWGDGPSGQATAPVTPAPGQPTQQFPPSTPAGVETPQPTEPVTGPTYSEMIDKKKAEERERAERAERERADRERAEREGTAQQAQPTDQTQPAPIQDPPTKQL